MTPLLDALAPALASAVRAALDRSEGTARDAATASSIAAAALDDLRSDPTVRHAANAEPWYRSRVTLGAILSASAPLLGLFGLELTPDNKEAILALAVAAGGVVGPALTLYGRWRATKPLGS